MSATKVLAFSAENLHGALANANATAAEISAHGPATYLWEYLQYMRAAALVVEDPYTDADFLDDYTAYYARCYSAFGRRCKRLHFFRRELTDESFGQLVSAQQQDDTLQRDYLGFVVVRPLPQTIIGRCVLKAYDDDGGARRHFPVNRRYNISLFGLDLYIDGLAYQEQDTVLAACATVALWSAFHRTGDLFGTAVPTPAVITQAATQAVNSVHYGRPIPQHGLRVEEMCAAIRHNGLEPEAINLQRTPNVPVVSLLYGYMRMGLPAILIVEIPGRGWHAITLTGYSLLSNGYRMQEVPGNPTIAPMVGLRIDKFYGHDDQIGPNAKLVIQDSPSPKPVQTDCAIRFESTWTDAHGDHCLYPVAVTVPIYNKIRLTFLEVQAWITPLHALFSGVLPEPVRIEWDVHLILSNDLKRELKNDPNLGSSVRESLLFTHHPRFWWRATMLYAGLPFCHLLFDATGIARSFPLTTVIWPVEGLAVFMQRLLDDANPAVLAIRRMLKTDRYVQFLRETLDHRTKPGELLHRHLAF